MSTYILWDWNGTLLDDTASCVSALNVLLAANGRPPLDLATFRERFFFPSRTFYAMLGVPVDDAVWADVVRTFFAAYRAHPSALAADAAVALAEVRRRGVRQSILSAMREDVLQAEVAAHGLVPYFASVCGTDNLEGATKLDRAQRLAAQLRAEASGPLDLVLIGDALHDHEVASAVGMRCILYTGGSHTAERLRSAAPTADTLVDAVRLALATQE